MDLNDIEALATLLKEHAVSEISVSGKDGSVHLRKNPLSVSNVVAAPIPTIPLEQPGGGSHASGRGNRKKTASDPPGDPSVILPSQLVGIFHHANPIVRTGSTVKAGQTIGHVETMKLMNEVVVEADSQIVEVTVDDGETVMYGQPLFRMVPA